MTNVVRLNARDQLRAMVMASHNRCGAASPARHFVSLPPLATAPFWDWCLHDSEIVFGVSIFFGIYNVMHYVILGISTALMGVTRSTFRLRDANLEHLTGIKKKYDDMWRTPHPIGPDQLVVQGSISSGTISKFCVVNSLVKSATYMTSSSRVLFQGPGFSYGHNANNKWWLYHFRNLSGVPSLIVADLSDQSNVFHQADEQQPQQHGVLTVVCPPYEGHSDSEYSEWKQLECSHVSFNNSIPDEALLVFDSLATAELLLVLIDVKSTYITNTTVVLSTTRWLSPDILYFASTRALVMRLHPPACKRVLLLHDSENRCLYEVTEGTGSCRIISPEVLKLSQLSSSLFCTSRSDGSIEVWDCNNTSAPLRTLQPGPNSLPLQFVAHSGFIFHQHKAPETNTIDITDSHDCHVCTLSECYSEPTFIVNSL